MDDLSATAMAWSIFLLLLPLVVGGALHMWIVKRDDLAFLARPIHRAWFGANKTWRGLVLMPPLTVIGCGLVRALLPFAPGSTERMFGDVGFVGLGLWLGVAYVLAELPNSYVKRRLGIPPGGQADRHRFWFTFLDQADSAIGCAIVYVALLDVPIAVLVVAVLLGPVIHLVANVSLYAAGLRKEAF